MNARLLCLPILGLLAAAGCQKPAEAPPEPTAAAAATTWTCPMHPSIHQASPGSCPICGMDLVPVTAEQQASGEVIVDGLRRQKIGVVTAPVTRGPLVREVRALGTAVVDQSSQSVVTTKVDGFVHDPVVVAAGQTVRAGQRLFDLWSPELQAAQADLVAAAGGPGAAAAATRLRRWDVPASLIQSLQSGGAPRDQVPVLAERSGIVTQTSLVEGARVMAGEPLLTLVRLDRIWVDATIYAEDVPYVLPGMPVSVQLSDQPARVDGQVSVLLPEVDPMTRARKVRVTVDNADGLLLPGAAVELSLQAPLGEALSVPADAVIFTGPRRMVFVDLGEGRLAPREVSLGARVGDRYEITSGLQAGDQVVSEGAFLVAAESRIRSAAGVWGHDHDGQ